MTHVINLFGGPGTGKSTTAAGLFFALKSEGVSCELASEYAKDAVWGETTAVLRNQIYVFGKQHQRINRLIDKVDYVITDSPLLMSCMYGEHVGEHFLQLVDIEHRKFNNINIFLHRQKQYISAGRLQNEEEARGMDDKLRLLLRFYGVPFHEVNADRFAPDRIVRNILKIDP